MHLKALVRCSTSVLILAAAISPAWAQEEPDDEVTTAQDPGAVGQEETSDEESASEGEEILVTGLRASLRSAQNIRRNSEQIVDAVVAEDIGKLPDIAVSDTAARIPGIQVERSGGEASRVLLRGLDRFNYTTTYNGREIFTAETRSVALQDFPAGGISAIEVFKTASANLIEPGIAGLINVRSRRPFDFQGFEVAGSLWGVYPNQSRDIEPNAQLLLSNRWDAGEGEFGALINFSYTRLHYRDSVRRHDFFIAGLEGGRSPDYPQLFYFEGERSRPSINGALQWRPNPDLEFYVEGLWQGYREELTDRLWQVPLWGGASYSNIVRDGPNIISGTVDRPAQCCGGGERTLGFQGATTRETDTFQFAAGGRWDAGPLRVSADLARTDSQFDLRTESVDYQLNTNNFQVDWFTGRPGGPGPTFQVRGIDPLNPAIYNYRGFFEDYLTASGDDWQARLDLEYEPGDSIDFIPRIRAGVRFVDRDASAVAGAFYWNFFGRGIPISAVPLDYIAQPGGFRNDDNPPFPLSWLGPSFESVQRNLVQLRQFNITRCTQLNSQPNCGSVDGPPTDPGRTFAINEQSLAGYGQILYEFSPGDVTIDGSVGMRVVGTREDISGTVFGNTGGPQPINFETSYTDWLPDANMRIEFQPGLQARFAVSRTMTRPTFGQLNPSLRLDPPPGCTPGGPVDCVRTGSGGNPFLEPLRSTNYDASIEYYFSPTGWVAASVFRRDMEGFITNRRFEFPEPDPQTNLPLLITGPVNTREARLQGFEFQFSSFFDFLPGMLRGLGAQFNLTYIDAEADFDVLCDPVTPACTPTGAFPNAATIRDRIPDVSRWVYNLVGMYERGGLTLRLAYNRRTGFPEGPLAERDRFYTLQGRGHAVERLDWSSSYAVTDNLTVFFDWTNILNNPFRSDIVRVNRPGGVPQAPEIFPMVVRFEESVISGGVRFRF